MLKFGLSIAILLAATPALAQREATARSPESWLTAADFPTTPGSITVTLTMSAGGVATACSAAVTSGKAALDAELCAKLRRRARFIPATDATGTAVPGSWTYRYSWPVPN
jgi:protein TonB